MILSLTLENKNKRIYLLANFTNLYLEFLPKNSANSSFSYSEFGPTTIYYSIYKYWPNS